MMDDDASNRPVKKRLMIYKESFVCLGLSDAFFVSIKGAHKANKFLLK